jgi:hypothetical protein
MAASSAIDHGRATLCTVMLHQALICPVGFCSLWAHSAGFVMKGSLVGRSNSSSDADVAPPGDDDADELAALVPRSSLALRRLARVRAARKLLAADRLAEVGARISHREVDNNRRVLRKSQRPESRTRCRTRRDGPNRHDPSHRGPSRRPNHQRRQGSIPERQRVVVHNLLFASLLACSSQAANGYRENLFLG